MKQILTLLILSLVIAVPVTIVRAVKYSENKAGSVNYYWHLPSTVIPMSPGEALDIPDSDTASQLRVNRPNGRVKLNMTGFMRNLHPDTNYQVLLSKSYSKYENTGWNISGFWLINYQIPGGFVAYDMNLSQTGNNVTGAGGYPQEGPYSIETTVSSGTTVGDKVNLTINYTKGKSGTMTMVGSISTTGTLSGTWTDTLGGSGVWSSRVGTAVKTDTGSDYWPGLLEGVESFNFMTNASASGTWSYQFKDKAPEDFSIWIKEGSKVVLISDSISF